MPRVYRWFYTRGASSSNDRPVEGPPDVGCTLSTPTVVSDHTSTEARKFELELADQRRIEAVFIPDTPAISTQVGCAMGCGC
jgi:adenine C2-methylase RlmN of 23S rRNA A2503 and tRNA A37